ncbi:signal transduction protein containing a membrane domain an EAL anda GGDEF domain-like [Pseudooceanicola batsensis HTCC2597]|uniref:Signal transduction protein containing a membrane domain an EAL anda GGDEF domain-like n=1 Tax=Pseudooceanicola batsensis (strain ATCC BAA-863 / DSM 15984 / KCTC 12145 / HTCC2597) TaxID=252305 RepID=A3TU97_PSEBH|nr:bifunctional diguanylate cyclase/phosphodiesterase [Pseudooceanicola batsensis]EAQ04093.1 signal transduction protein containing a membrane domain an EAL anda GGDEF domain-like [Pseudooceanicola batsensis HTCC2597]
MTSHPPDDAAFEAGVPATELERLLEIFRDAAQASLDAHAVVLLADTTGVGGLAPDIALVPGGAVAQSLGDHAMLRLRLTTSRDGSAARRDDRDRSEARQVHGTHFVFHTLPLTGPDAESAGLLAFAFDGRPGDHRAEACRRLARCAEAIWATHDTLSGLAYEVMTLTSRTARLKRISETDALTQLENRTSFENKVRAELEAAPESAAFLIIDIDHFKLTNDLYGHQFGDTYLTTIARALGASFPETSIIGRLGGDEFGVFTPIPTGGRAYLDGLLARCRSNIQRATATLSKPDMGHVSIGASQFPDHATRYSTLYDQADSALYAAKNAGRGVSTVYDPTHHKQYNNSQLGQQFLDAVERHDILPCFQPIVDLTTGDCAGFEILARWRDSSGHKLIPSQFSAIFRDHALAEKMTRAIMQRAFRDHARAVAPTGRALSLALNVTFFDLMNPEFAFEVQSTIAETGFDWSLLTIEVTEQIMLGEPNGQVFRSLNELRRRGARIALDDFGTGYGGLRHLAQWPVDILKIDKYFVDGISAGDRDRAILETITDLARRLGIDVVAEGIETPDQVTGLRDRGCRYGQGFLFDAPLAGDDLPGFRPTYDIK